MISALFKYVVSNLPIIALVTSVLGCYYAFERRGAEIKRLDQLTSDMELSIHVKDDTISELRQKINDQNDSIQMLKSESDKREREGAVESAKARVIMEQYRRDAQRIITVPVPGNLNTCSEAEFLIDQEIANAR